MQAYEERLKPLETLEERWRKYPGLAVEARKLEIYQRLIEAAQALGKQIKGSSSPSKEPSREENRKENQTHIEIKEQTENLVEHKEENEGENLPSQSLELGKALEPKLISNASIPEVVEDWGNKLWDAIKTTQGQKGSIDAEPPIGEIDFDQKTLELKIKIRVWRSGF